jgi:uncharacterized surface protein with fasciclin (FAS1) repeats
MRSIQRGGLVAVALLVAALGTACGSDDTADPGTDVSESTGESSAPMEESTEPMEENTDAAMDDMGDLVGAGCAGYAEAVPDGEGSVEGMADDPVSVAASNNPILTTLVAAVSGGVNPNVNLVSTIDGGEFTIFAPVDDAFAKLDQATLDALAADDGTLLSTILTYHVISGRLAPADLVGMQTTVQGEDVEVAGEGDEITVNGTTSVICGNVQTANATVYLIDTVLTPPSMM